MKKSILIGIIATTLQTAIGLAAPAGICLHAKSPETPADKIECIEYEKIAREGENVRVYIAGGRSFVITAYRFRGAIQYKPELSPTHPDFEKLLKTYEETARNTPSTRPFLNSKIMAMRNQTAPVKKQEKTSAKLPSIRLADGSTLMECKMTKIENGEVSIMHKNGGKRVNIKDLNEEAKISLNATTEDWSLEDPSVSPIDSSGTFARIIFKNGVLLNKAQFKSVANTNLVFIIDGKSVSVPADQFPGDLSVLGEKAMTALAKVNEKHVDGPVAQKKSLGNAIEKEHFKSIDKLRKSAELGNAAAQFNLAHRYAEGLGVSVDAAEAAKWYRKAADQGYIAAQVNLSRCYEQGTGLPADKDQATMWRRKATDQGYVSDSESELLYHDDTEELSVDRTKLVHSYRKAADQGDAAAQYNLAQCYAKGEGVLADFKEAAKWYRKAADQGHATAQVKLARCYVVGGCGLQEDRSEALKYYRKAADQGNSEAQFWLGNFHMGGIGVAEDKTEAVKWLRKAAEQGHIDAQFNMARCYQYERGVARDESEAVKWYRKAAEQGDVYAQIELAQIYLKAGENADKWLLLASNQGDPTAQMTLISSMFDLEESLKISQAGAEQGDASAQHLLGVHYATGTGGCSIDYKEALKWYRKAADQGLAKAQVFLARCYEKGEGSPKDMILAYMWYSIADSSGYTSASVLKERASKSMTRDQLIEAQELSHLMKPKKSASENLVGKPDVDAATESDPDAVEFQKNLNAAKQGDSLAQYNLGLAYDRGIGVVEDDVEAVKWYRKAAEQGHLLAQSNLGSAYAEGDGVVEDHEEAFKWYRKAAVKGDATTQFLLGVKYLTGKGVDENHIESYRWLLLASAQGVDAANVPIRFLDEKLTPEQRAEGQRLAKEWQDNFEKEQTDK